MGRAIDSFSPKALSHGPPVDVARVLAAALTSITCACYTWLMNRAFVPLFIFAALASALAAEAPNWAGEYADKKFLNGKAVFQLSIEQSGTAIQVSFDAVYNDGHGAAPEAHCPARVSAKGMLEFNFQDSFHNAGLGTIRRANDDVIVSLKTTRVADARCLAFYNQNMRLKRVGK